MENIKVDNLLEKALELIGKKHDLLIIEDFLKHRNIRRFNDLINDIPQINPRILSMRLKDLEKNKLIKKNLVLGDKVTSEYHLTEKADGLEKVINELKEWAKNQK
ncbi:MAG: helix-turn-helix domain-containing protein [Candidatus ainarchaeum sp.]|nr:helix-turn-helix domain-containing protein [Candidatus ainarchaeum sp.]